MPALDQIVSTAWQWHSKHPRGYADQVSPAEAVTV